MLYSLIMLTKYLIIFKFVSKVLIIEIYKKFSFRKFRKQIRKNLRENLNIFRFNGRPLEFTEIEDILGSFSNYVTL